MYLRSIKPSLIIVGLGNLGATYDNTRHNVGFQAVDVLSEAFDGTPWADRQKFKAIVSEGHIVTVPVLLVKPTTYMNASGECIRKLVDFFKIEPKDQLIVISDDIDLPLGDVRMRMKGGPGTHNGLRSIVDTIGEDFPRIRIGLGDHPTGEELANWVLSSAPPEDRKTLEKTIETIPVMIREYILSSKNRP